ncbi:hypothetical protein [Rhizobium nepotum]|uniref:hypothetical protein n=1 Tax=Rhizobium nepotum TaxID=1035271 RepID=UPI003CF2B802
MSGTKKATSSSSAANVSAFPRIRRKPWIVRPLRRRFPKLGGAFSKSIESLLDTEGNELGRDISSSSMALQQAIGCLR